MCLLQIQLDNFFLTIIKILTKVYSRHPCEKPLMERVLLNQAKDLFICSTGAIMTEYSSLTSLMSYTGD